MPNCALCPENNPVVLNEFEAHHIFGKAYSSDTVMLCKNCHTKITFEQNLLAPKYRSGKTSKLITLFAIYSCFSLLKLIGENGIKMTKQLIEADKNENDTTSVHRTETK